MATINFSRQAIAENNQALRELDVLIVKFAGQNPSRKELGIFCDECWHS